jgi:hypothetical protein
MMQIDFAAATTNSPCAFTVQDILMLAANAHSSPHTHLHDPSR